MADDPWMKVEINSGLILHESRSQDPDARSLTVVEELSNSFRMFFEDVWAKNVDLERKTLVVTISLRDS